MTKDQVIGKICSAAPAVIKLVGELKTLTPGTRSYERKRKELNVAMKGFIKLHNRLDNARRTQSRNSRRQSVLEGMYSKEREII